MRRIDARKHVLAPDSDVGVPRVDVMDGLRALAILWVMWLHIWEISWFDMNTTIAGITLPLNMFAPVGSVGVDLFFFISGFCIYYPFAKRKAPSLTRVDLKQFYLRRAVKILPSYWLAISLALCLMPDAIPQGASFARHLGLHLLFIHNWFPDTFGSILGVFWSLGVEVQFYLVFPLLCRAYQTRPLLTWAAAATAAVVYRSYASSADVNSILVFQLPAFIDLFVTGMATAHLMTLESKVLNRRSQLIHLSNIGALCAAAYLVWMIWQGYNIRYDAPGIPGWKLAQRLPMALGFAVLSLSLSNASQGFKALATNRVFLWLSAISYNLYIYHQAIGRTIAASGLVSYHGAQPQQDPEWQVRVFALSVIVSLICASIVTYLFERPLINMTRNRRKTKEQVPLSPTHTDQKLSA